MNKLEVASIATVFAIAFSTGAIAQDMSKSDYKSARNGISIEYRSAVKICTEISGNKKNLCMAEASGREKVARAELEVRSSPGSKSSYALSIAQADAEYSAASAKCDDNDGSTKKACVEEAKVLLTKATADAKAQMKTANAAAAEVSARNPAEVITAVTASTGKPLFEASCKGCHAAMRPKIGDREAWAPLIRQGADALTASVIKGKGVMPPRGGAASDADVKAAVEYMMSQAK